MNPFRRHKKNTPERRQVSRLGSAVESDTFRRGRTLTGSASSHVRTLSESQADLTSSRVRRHQLIKKRRRVVSFFIATLLMGVGLYGLISQFTTQPVVRASPDTSLQLDSSYAHTIDSYFSDHPSERLRLLTNVDRLAAHLRSKHPEVKVVEQGGSVGYGKSLYELTFRQPIASWTVDEHRLYVDADGTPFERNYFGQPDLRITDQSGMSALSGQAVMSNRFMSFIGQVITLSEGEGYSVESITIPEGMTRQIDVELEKVGYRFKFSSDRPAGEGVEDMIRAHRWMQARRLNPDYIDVRVSGRVFYRD